MYCNPPPVIRLVFSPRSSPQNGSWRVEKSPNLIVERRSEAEPQFSAAKRPPLSARGAPLLNSAVPAEKRTCVADLRADLLLRNYKTAQQRKTHTAQLPPSRENGRSCFDFVIEVIFVPCQVVFSPVEGDIAAPMASEAGEKSADRGREERRLQIQNNF
jgi:hypothetical protein